ncbi:MAG: electron transport complex subunit RsxB [Burkholderiaceae bacterium]
MNASRVLEQALNDALPQTQCTRCGYPDCRSYAHAIAIGDAEINQCPPGGQEGVERLAALTGRPVRRLDPARGAETPRLLAVIDEDWCIGCTLCLKACAVDCIVGGPKLMHSVIDAQCTGCELCVPACPVDCIALVPVTGVRTGWQAWSDVQAREARERFDWHRQREQRENLHTKERLAASSPKTPSDAAHQPPASAGLDKRSVIAAALARAKAARGN